MAFLWTAQVYSYCFNCNFLAYFFYPRHWFFLYSPFAYFVAIECEIVNISNAQILTANLTTMMPFESTIEYECYSGFILSSGDYNNTCSGTGNWTNLPTCSCEFINIQLLTGFEDNSSFVWPETRDESFAQSRRLRATDPFEGQTKLLLSEEPVYNCFVIHLHFFKIFLFTLSTHIFIRCFQYALPSSPKIWTTPRHCYVNIMWRIEPMKIRR